MKDHTKERMQMSGSVERMTRVRKREERKREREEREKVTLSFYQQEENQMKIDYFYRLLTHIYTKNFIFNEWDGLHQDG